MWLDPEEKLLGLRSLCSSHLAAHAQRESPYLNWPTALTSTRMAFNGTVLPAPGANWRRSRPAGSSQRAHVRATSGTMPPTTTHHDQGATEGQAPLTTCSGAKSQAGSASPRTLERHRGQVVTKVKDKEPILVTAPEAARTPPTRGPCQQAPLRGKAPSRRCMRTLTRSPLLYFTPVPGP